MAVELIKCGKEGCDPQLQVRGKMGFGDYALYLGSWRVPHDAVGVPIDTGNGKADAVGPGRYFEFVELDASNKDDIRVFCKVCGRATGWVKSSVEVPGRDPIDLTGECLNDWNKQTQGT